MAMIVCAKCQKIYSERAKACPDCAESTKENKGNVPITCQECKKQYGLRNKACIHCGNPTPMLHPLFKSEGFKMLMGIGGFFLLIYMTYWVASGSRNVINAAVNPTPSDIAKAATVLKYDWTLEGGIVGTATFTVKNNSPYTIKDITVQCDYMGQSGTQVSNQKQTLYGTVQPKGSKTFKDINMGFVNSQASKASCYILSVVVD